MDNEAQWQAIIGNMDTEDWTVGAWNMLLCSVFQAPEYLVIPELRSSAGRADLAVIQVSSNRLVLVVEGKKSGGGFLTVGNAINQAIGYMKDFKGSTPGIVAALGPVFALATETGKPVGSAFTEGKDKGGIYVWAFNTYNITKILAKLEMCKKSNGAGGW